MGIIMGKMTVLPGDARQRITELRLEKGLNQKQLAKEISKTQDYYVDESTISRIENGDVRKIGHELLIAMSKYFGATTDYILGLTDDRMKSSYEIGELGLSYEAARRLVNGLVNSDAVNRLIETPEFPLFSELITQYFNSSMFEEYAKLRQFLPTPDMILEDFNGSNITDINKDKCKAMLEMFTDLQEPVEMQSDRLQHHYATEAGAINHLFMDDVYSRIEDMPMRDQLILAVRNGLYGCTPISLTEAADLFSVSEFVLKRDERRICQELYRSLIERHAKAGDIKQLRRDNKELSEKADRAEKKHRRAGQTSQQHRRLLDECREEKAATDPRIIRKR